MASIIDPTKPADGVDAVKADLRANLQAAKDEIEALQAAAALPAGGSTGQRLTKLSGADYDAGWQTPSATGTTTPVGCVTPEDYGAVGDNSTDNVTAFNAMCTALSDGGAAESSNLWISAGNTYLSSGNHQITGRDELIIYGNGSTFKRHSDFSPPGGSTLAIFFEMYDCRRFAIRDLKFHGNRAAISPNGEQSHNFRVASYCSDYVIDHCHFIKSCSGDGAILGASNADAKSPTAYPDCIPMRGTWNECLFDDNYRNGMTALYFYNHRFVGCSFVNTNGASGGPCDGIDIEPLTSITEAPLRRDGVRGVQFIGCTFADNEGRGLAVTTGGDEDWDLKSISIVASHFEGNLGTKGGGCALRFRGGSGCVVQGNTFRGHTAVPDGGDLDDAHRSLIWVHFKNAGDSGTEISPAEDPIGIVIDGNTFVDNPGCCGVAMTRKTWTPTATTNYRRQHVRFTNNYCDMRTGMTAGVASGEDTGPHMVSVQTENWTITHNTFIGDGATSGIEGVRLVATAAGADPANCIVDDNYFRDLAVGVRVADGAHYSVSGNVFENIEGSGNEIIVAGGASVSRQVNNVGV